MSKGGIADYGAQPGPEGRLVPVVTRQGLRQRGEDLLGEIIDVILTHPQATKDEGDKAAVGLVELGPSAFIARITGPLDQGLPCLVVVGGCFQGRLNCATARRG